MEHTPIPWTVAGKAGEIMDVVVVGPKSQGVCEMTGHVGQDRDADAAFIVRAGNNHTKLLSALEEGQRVVAIFNGLLSENMHYEELVGILDSLLDSFGAIADATIEEAKK